MHVTQIKQDLNDFVLSVSIRRLQSAGCLVRRLVEFSVKCHQKRKAKILQKLRGLCLHSKKRL